MNRASRILLVDDEVVIQRALAPLLRSHGYEVEVAGTGREALSAVAARSPDLIVLDLGLPDLDGAEVCRRIRLESKAPIVVLSARGSEADKVAALDIGADDYVTKPFGSEELLARIRVALRRVEDAAGPEVDRMTVADLVIDYKKQGFESVLRDYDVVLNSQDKSTLEKSLGALKPGGSGPPDPDFAKTRGSSWVLARRASFWRF